MSLQESRSVLRLSPESPWPGLQSFDESSSAFFFGRQTETDTLFRLMRRQTLTVFYGRSGLGKTSLLQAGLFPRLRDASHLPVLIRVDYGAKAQPVISQIKRAIGEALREKEIDARPPAEEESLWEYFHASGVDFWDKQNRLVTLVLAFDQFEERFTLGRHSVEADSEAEVFLTEISQLVENRPPQRLQTKFEADPDTVAGFDFDKQACKVILSLREDFLPELENLRARFPTILENSFRLQGMTEQEAMDVILQPGSSLVGKEVASEIVAFVAGGEKARQSFCTVEPVLLSVVLYELNERRRQNGHPLITSNLLSGSRDEILDGFYETALAGLPPQARLLVEDGLLTSGGRRDSLAWEDALAEFGVEEQPLLTLIDRHLVRREDRADGTRIELVHDRLAEVVRKRRDASHEYERQQTEITRIKAREAELEREKEAHRRRSRKLFIACVALALFGALVSGYLVWDRYAHRWEHEVYYNSFFKRWDVPEGVGLLTKQQVARRHFSLRFVYRGAYGPLLRVEAVDSQGKLTTHHEVGTYMRNVDADDNPNRECRWEFIRDANGFVAYELLYSKNGDLRLGFVYSPRSNNSLQRMAHFVGPNGLPQSEKGTVAEYVQIDYWPDGTEKQISYKDRFGHSQIGRDGGYTLFEKHDPSGLPAGYVLLDARGNPMIGTEGFAMTAVKYDKLGNRLEWACFDVSGKPCISKDGEGIEKANYDPEGNLSEIGCFDNAGKPCMSRYGYAKKTLKYNDLGYPIELAYFDGQGHPAIEQSTGAHQQKRTYDARGNALEESYYGVDGKPNVTKSGYAKMSAKYDDLGHQVEWACFDLLGQPAIEQSLGTHMSRQIYDAQGNVLETSYYGVDGKPHATKSGYAKINAKFDDLGHQIEWACYDTLGQPAIEQSLGTHLSRTVYDARGNWLVWTYYGVNGKPCLTKSGYAKTTAKYDELGHQIEWACFDTLDKPAIDQARGNHMWRQAYDARGNVLETSYHGIDDKPCLIKDGYAKATAKYDELGHQIEWACFDTLDKPTIDQTVGNHMWRQAYDARGSIAETSYYGIDDKLCVTKSGYARVSAKYDDLGHQIEWACFDTLGKPTIDGTYGNHMWRQMYDARGNILETSYHGIDDKPCLTKSGYAKSTAKYDDCGHQIEWACFDTLGKPAIDEALGNHMSRTVYDAIGNALETSYHGVDGKLLVAKNGYAKTRAKYDDFGHQIEWACFDNLDQPTIDPAFGNHMSRKIYDARGNWIEWTYYGVDGKPCIMKNGYAKATAKYDLQGNQIEEAYFDIQEKPVPWKGGYAKVTAKYDETGHRPGIVRFRR